MRRSRSWKQVAELRSALPGGLPAFTRSRFARSSLVPTPVGCRLRRSPVWESLGGSTTGSAGLIVVLLIAIVVAYFWFAAKRSDRNQPLWIGIGVASFLASALATFIVAAAAANYLRPTSGKIDPVEGGLLFIAPPIGGLLGAIIVKRRFLSKNTNPRD